MTLTSLTYENTLRELPTDEGVLRYHEAGDGPPLLLLHGSGPGVTGWRNYRGNLPVFARHFRTLVLEFPGFGVSDPTDENPMAAAPKAVLRFLEGLGLDRVDVVGNSMGGFVAVGLAVAHKDLFRRVVTIGEWAATSSPRRPAKGSTCWWSSPRTPPGRTSCSGCGRWSTTPPSSPTN